MLHISLKTDKNAKNNRRRGNKAAGKAVIVFQCILKHKTNRQ